MGCAYERKRLAGTDVWDVLATGNNFEYIIVFFSSTIRITVFKRSSVTQDLILPSVCARRAYPRRFLGRVGRTPLLPTLTWRRFQRPSRKGVKTVRLGAHCTSDGLLNLDHGDTHIHNIDAKRCKVNNDS